jgi:hypothetical protein
MVVAQCKLAILAITYLANFSVINDEKWRFCVHFTDNRDIKKRTVKKEPLRTNNSRLSFLRLIESPASKTFSIPVFIASQELA